MCVSTGPSQMSNTILFAAEVRGPNDTPEHVLGYQNAASSEGPNAMLLALPAAHPLGPEHGIDARAFPRLLTDLRELTTPRTRSMSRGLDTLSAPSAAFFEVGSYAVLSAPDPRLFAAELGRIPETKRPAPNPAIFDAYAAWYPGWQFALCCWSGDIKAEPLLWRFESLRPDYLFLPGLDAHDGGLPKVGREVDRDHHLVWGSSVRPGPGGGVWTARVREGLPPGASRLVPDTVRGQKRQGDGRNGDWWVLLDALDRGPAIEMPAGWAA